MTVLPNNPPCKVTASCGAVGYPKIHEKLHFKCHTEGGESTTYFSVYGTERECKWSIVKACKMSSDLFAERLMCL